MSTLRFLRKCYLFRKCKRRGCCIFSQSHHWKCFGSLDTFYRFKTFGLSSRDLSYQLTLSNLCSVSFVSPIEGPKLNLATFPTNCFFFGLSSLKECQVNWFLGAFCFSNFVNQPDYTVLLCFDRQSDWSYYSFFGFGWDGELVLYSCYFWNGLIWWKFVSAKG